MKILKPGKVEMRKFVCTKCWCEFVVSECETERLSTDGTDYAICPTCNRPQYWFDGEIYL